MGSVTCDMAMSIDGFVAGPNQTLDNPLGEGIEDRLHGWMWARDAADVDAIDQITVAKAFIMGRNMFGPVRGSWDTWEGEWRGWWGEDPPYHAPVFVLTHHPREPLVMSGGTTFHFVTEGVAVAVRQARAAAGDRDVVVAGGAHTVRSALAARLIDEITLHLVPLVLGEGERLFEGLDGLALEPLEVVSSPTVTHLRYCVPKA